MWARAQIFGRGIDRRAWSPLWTALIAALVLEPEVARAADDEARPLIPLRSEALSNSASPSGREVVPPAPAPLPTLTPPPAMTSGAPPFAGEQAPPIRLDARAVLSLSETFPFSDPWRAPRPSFETAIRTLELGDLRAVPEPAVDDPLHVPGRLPDAPAGWFDQHIELSFDDGIAYKENFTWRGMNLRLKIWGPVVKSDPGVGVRLRGLQLGGHGVDLRARATTHLQDVQVQIAF